jgi:antirestriction protein ArdC
VSELIATPVTDKNGKQTTVHKKPVTSGTGAKRASKVAPKSAAVKKTYEKKGPTLTEKLEGYKEELKSRVTALADDANWNHYLTSMSKFHNYSWNNQILIDIQTKGQATHVAGYKTWQSLGRTVNGGEKAIAIIGFRKIKVDATDRNGNKIMGADGKPEKKEIPNFFGTGVFDIAQTSGDALPEAHAKMTAEPPVGLTNDLEATIKAKGFSVEYVDNLRGAKGSTSTDPNRKVVQILSSLNDGERAKTLAHELFHIASGHIERADEYHTGHGGQRNAMEVEAESGAYVLLRANGMDEHADTSATYVAGWAGVRGGNDREKMVANAAENVAKTTRSLLTDFEWQNSDLV